MQSSCAQRLRAELGDDELTRRIRSLSPAELQALEYDWKFWARPNQLPPPGDDWVTWNLRAGRGFGKTRVGAEWVNSCVEAAQYGLIALVGPTASDTRDVMVEGESGILARSPPWFRPKYEPAKRRITWPNGARATLFSADEPERLRGPQHDAAWSDELLAWRFLEEAWDNLQFGLRLGQHPRQLITSTPKPHKILKAIEADAGTVTVRGTTYDNKDNLAPTFLTKIVAKYEGTRLGRQELLAEILEDNPGALWQRSTIEANRVSKDKLPIFRRVVIGNDPKVSNEATSDEWGIIAGALGEDGHGYVLDDRTCRESVDKCLTEAIRAYKDYKADRLVAEDNNGGELVRVGVHSKDPNVAYKGVHASRGKFSRAEPVAALYEQGRVHHVGSFPALEDQMCDYDPTTAKRSPDRMDALVWTFTELMLDTPDTAVLDSLRDEVKDHQRREASEREAERKHRP